MFRRSSHLAVRVQPGQLEDAVDHYCRLFGLTEESRSGAGVELKGCNFTLWLDESEVPTVVHEFDANNLEEAKRAVVESGATITGESSHGFYVQDPYGLRYHVFIEDEPEV